MKLQEVEPKTDLMLKALEDGIETLEDYSVWITGYITGTREAREAIQNEMQDLLQSNR